MMPKDTNSKIIGRIKEAGIDLSSQEKIDNFIKSIELLPKIQRRYANNPLHHISKFVDANHLGKYISSAFHINALSNDSVTDHFKMNHILFKIIKQNYISLYNLLSYQFNTLTIDDLKDSYNRSSDLQKDLVKSIELNGIQSERLAWFVNLKNPSTYWKNAEVKKHYSFIIKNFHDIKEVDLRRMHVFYDVYFDKESSLNFDQVKFTFQGLLFERLIGINNKLIIINKFDDIKGLVHFSPEEGEEISDPYFKSLFLLDYALFQYPRHQKAKTSVDYELHLLPADFSLDPPIENAEMIHSLVEKYSNEAVYELNGPYLFYIFKRNYQSFWNKEKYISSLDDLIFHRIWRILQKNKKNILNKIIDSDYIAAIKSELETEIINSEFLQHIKNRPDFDSTKNTIKRIFKILTIEDNNFLSENSEAVTDLESSFIYSLFEFLPQFNQIVLGLDDDNSDNELEKEIYTIRKIFSENIEVMDLFSFWKRITAQHSFTIDDLIGDDFYSDENENMSEYLRKLEDNKDEDYSELSKRNELRGDLKKCCLRFFDKTLSMTTDIDDIEQKFQKVFSEFIIRKT